MKKISQKSFLFLLCLMSWQVWAQQPNITGVVSDENGVPLPGVNVKVKNTSIGTVANFDCEFSFENLR